MLPLPQQAGHGVWGNGAHGSRGTDGTLIPKTHQGLQQLPLELSECLWLHEAGQRGAASTQGRHQASWLSGVDVSELEPSGFGARRPVWTCRGVAGGDCAICWGALSPLAGSPWGSTALGSLQGRIEPSLVR